ncbi:MAG TPA: DUF1552 domain-containing protein [Polyangiaceae bacterium]|nr:DUF1552 domain-containing protein [Polyangiaceae bacterium]
MNRLFSRRTILRGAGVALALPWMESLAPKAARAQATAYPKRFIPIFFPNGSAEWFRPTGVGAGANWQLSPILQPFEALKSKMNVLTYMQNWSAFNANNASVEPSHGRQPGAFLTCVDGSKVSDDTGVDESNGISVDQVIASHANYSGLTPLASLQVGASTWESYCDGKPCSYSRSISWKSPTQPMYKQVDPLEIFNTIVGAAPAPGGGGGGTPDPEAEKRAALNKSVLDAVLESATRTRGKLGSADVVKMDEFMESVRAVEQRATMVSTGISTLECSPITAPTMAATPDGFQDNTAAYNKGTHVEVINDLIVMALQCDVTRVISYMMEDERSEFVYSHVPQREFSAAGSVEGNGGTCGNYHGSQHAGDANDGFASINWWQSVKVAELLSKMDAIVEADGRTLLDNSLVMYASCMHGGNHQCDDIPVALFGSAGGAFKTDQHIQFAPFPGDRAMRDLYYTIMNNYFELGVTDFGVNLAGTPISPISELLV